MAPCMRGTRPDSLGVGPNLAGVGPTWANFGNHGLSLAHTQGGRHRGNAGADFGSTLVSIPGRLGPCSVELAKVEYSRQAPVQTGADSKDVDRTRRETAAKPVAESANEPEISSKIRTALAPALGRCRATSQIDLVKRFPELSPRRFASLLRPLCSAYFSRQSGRAAL